MFFFGRKKKQTIVTKTTKEKIKFEQVEDARDSLITRLATDLINGFPLVLNLSLLSVDDANKITTFLAGVVYTIEGHYFEIKERIVLYGDSKLYDDGTIKEFLDNL